MDRQRMWMALALLALARCTWAGPDILGVDDARIELVGDQSLTMDSHGPWQEWIRTVATSVSGIAGQFPQSRVRVLLDTSTRRNPIAYGRVRRNDPPEIHLEVHPEATLAGLLDDWRGYHEFAHLLIPFPGNQDIWFSEGLASYYQHLLQVRAGVIDPDEGWQRLFAGFRRGLDDPHGKGWSLSELSPEMWRERAFRRVYWTGAAYFLRVDLRLRAESNGEESLDSTLAEFVRCCLDARHSRDAKRLVKELGRLSQPDIWQEEYERIIDARARPELEWAMDRLGIEWSGRTVRLSNAPDERSLRRRIALGTGSPAPPKNAFLDGD